jgi:hypothetical protein
MNWLSWLELALDITGLTGWFQRLVDNWQARQQGKKEQRLADLEAQNKQLQQQAQAQADMPLASADLDKLLTEHNI